MINLQWLELPMSRTLFYGPKDFRRLRLLLLKGINSAVYKWKKEKEKNRVCVLTIESILYLILRIFFPEAFAS